MTGLQAYKIVKKLPMPIAAFARMVDLHPSTIQYWRKGQKPNGPTIVLLRLIKADQTRMLKRIYDL